VNATSAFAIKKGYGPPLCFAKFHERIIVHVSPSTMNKIVKRFREFREICRTTIQPERSHITNFFVKCFAAINYI